MNNGDFPGKSLVYQRVYDFILGGTCCPYNLIFAWHLAPCAAVALYFSKPSSSKRFLMKYSTAWGRKDQERSTRNWWNGYGHNWEAIKNNIYHIYIYIIYDIILLYTQTWSKMQIKPLDRHWDTWGETTEDWFFCDHNKQGHQPSQKHRHVYVQTPHFWGQGFGATAILSYGMVYHSKTIFWFNISQWS